MRSFSAETARPALWIIVPAIPFHDEHGRERYRVLRNAIVRIGGLSYDEARSHVARNAAASDICSKWDCHGTVVNEQTGQQLRAAVARWEAELRAQDEYDPQIQPQNDESGISSKRDSAF